MGLADRLRQLTKKATDTAAEHKDQIDQALRKAATAADQRGGGKYHDQIAKAESQAEGYVENLKAHAPSDQPGRTAESADETPGQPAG
jgi:ElaB/YqjD/DUF883 family membrane-anchored ribosome-binding protein